MSKKPELFPLPTSAAELEVLLLRNCVPDTETVARATATLKQFLKSPSCVGPFLQQIAASPHAEARQLAAVILRHRINAHWKRLSHELQNELKATLLARMQNEPVRVVRMAVAALATALSKQLVSTGQWNELLQFLLAMSQSSTTEHRELAMMLFRSLADKIGPELKSHFQPLQAIFTRGLTDPSPRVRVDAIRALAALADMIGVRDEALINSYREAIPPLINLLRACLSKPEDEVNENILAQGFELFETLVEAEEGERIIAPYLNLITSFMLEIGSARNVPLVLRSSALEFVECAVKNLPGPLAAANLMDPILNVAFALCAEPYREDAMDASHRTPQNLGVKLLDAIMAHLPASGTFAAVLSGALQLAVTNAPLSKKAGFIALSTMAEWHAELMLEPIDTSASNPSSFTRPSLEELLKLILTGATDSDVSVREAAHLCLTQFVDHLQPEILDHYETIFRLCFSALDKPGEEYKVKLRAVVNVETVCENLDRQQMAPLLNLLLPRLLGIMQTYASMALPPLGGGGAATSKYGTSQASVDFDSDLDDDDDGPSPEFHRAQKIFGCCLSAVRAIIESSGPAFVQSPYYGQITPLLRQLLQRGVPGDDMLLPLRALATECYGHIVEALGKDQAKPILRELMDIVLRSFTLNYFPLHEACHSFFINVAATLGRDFAVYLQLVVPLILASATSDDGMVEVDDDDELNPDDHPAMAYSDDEQPDDHDIERMVSYSLRTGALDEKIKALHALQTVIEHCKDTFMPFLNGTLERIKLLCSYPHEDVMMEVIDVLVEMIYLLHGVIAKTPDDPIQAAAQKPIWTKGVVTPVPAPANTVIAEVLAQLLHLMDDRERKVAGNALRAFQELGLCFGLGAVYEDMVQISKKLVLFLQEKSRSQRKYRARKDSQNEESDQKHSQKSQAAAAAATHATGLPTADHDDILIDQVIDALVVLAKIGGTALDPLFVQAIPLLFHFLQPGRHPFDVSMAIGCFSELLEEIPSTLAPVLPRLVPIVVSGLSDPTVNVRRNSAVFVGNAALKMPQLLSGPIAGQCVQSLAAMLTPAPPHVKTNKLAYDDYCACADNACSAIAKFILADSANPPNPHLLGLFLSGLPLHSDMEEAKYVYPCLVQLFAKHPSSVFSQLPRVIQIFSELFLQQATVMAEETARAVYAPKITSRKLLPLAGDPSKVLPVEVMGPIKQLCTSLMQQCGPQMQQVLQSLPAPNSEAFVKVLR